MTGRLLHQRPRDPGKLYSLHEPEVDGISKGKARQRCEFGTLVSLAATLDGGFILGARPMPGNPYDGNTPDMADNRVGVGLCMRSDHRLWRRAYRGP